MCLNQLSVPTEVINLVLLPEIVGKALPEMASLPEDTPRYECHFVSGGIARMASNGLSRFSSSPVVSVARASKAWIAASPGQQGHRIPLSTVGEGTDSAPRMSDLWGVRR